MGNRWLISYLAVQTTLAAGSFALPDPASGAVQLSVVTGALLVLVGAILARRPKRVWGWWLIGLSAALTYAETLAVAAIYGLSRGQRVVTVWPLVLGILALLAFAAGLGVLGWRSAGSRGWDVLDASMTAIAAFLLAWVFYVNPRLAHSQSVFATVIAVAVPAASLLVLVMAVKLAMGGGLRTWSGRMLLLATASGLGAAALVSEPVGAQAVQTALPTVCLALAHIILLGAAGLAVGFANVVPTPPRPPPELPRWRMFLFVLLPLLAPIDVAVILMRTDASGPTYVAVVVPTVCATLIFLLLVVRLALVTQMARGRADELGRAAAEQDELQRELAYRALHDPLTGLANRRVLTERMEWLRDRCGEPQHVPGLGQALMMLDLDGFKDINDSFGHPVGDQLLIDVAHRLAGVVPREAVVVRLGGDEFAVLLENASHTEARRVAEATLAALRSPYFIGGRELFLSASLGLLTTHPQASPPSSSEGLRNVDRALYAAKKAGRNRVAEFKPGLLDQRLQQARTSTGLRYAISREELFLDYQPIVALENGEMVAVEALVRWRPGGGETVPPSKFISVAEQTSLIVDIGAWVLRRACRDACDWHAQSGITVGVNVSSRQLDEPSFADLVQEILAETGLPASALILELTESTLIENASDPSVRAQLGRLRARGVRVAIDDFGTGYSSLSYITRLPVDLVKIDSSFTSSSAGSMATHQTWAFVRAILELIASLELSAVAEGIETGEQADVLRQMGCPYAQGYYFSPPLPADQISGRIRSHEAVPHQ